MNMSRSRAIWGALLVLAGLFLLLQNLGVLAINAGGWLWALFFGLGGLAFLAVYARDQEHWWSLIPGFILVSLGALLALDSVAPRVADTWGGPLFLGGLSMAFWLIFLTRREHWWAVIPGGILLTLAGVAALGQISTGLETGGLFFLGLAATFGLVYLLPTPEGRMKWALIPASILLVLGLATLLAATAVLPYLWPLALILGGVYLLLRAGRTPKAKATPEKGEKSPQDLGQL
jgi:hypothetical protein